MPTSPQPPPVLHAASLLQGKAIPSPLQLRSCGQLVRDYLSAGIDAVVVAVFDRTFYLTAGEHVVCVGRCDLVAGPLHLVTTAPCTLRWTTLGLIRGQRTEWRRQTLQIGKSIAIDTVCLPPALAKEEMAQTGAAINSFILPSLIQFLEQAPDQGLGRLFADSPEPANRNAVLAAASAPARLLGDWLSCAQGFPVGTTLPRPCGVESLLGLGPGLTPSGDDLLGGCLLTLKHLGRHDIASCLWDQIRYHSGRTHTLSMAHLRAAALGYAVQPVERLLTSAKLSRPAEFVQCLFEVTRIGHTSGWDMLAGIELTLEALLRAKTADQPSSAC